jgi:hypothetical protein
MSDPAAEPAAAAPEPLPSTHGVAAPALPPAATDPAASADAPAADPSSSSSSTAAAADVVFPPRPTPQPSSTSSPAEKDHHHKCRHHKNKERAESRKQKRLAEAARQRELANQPPPSMAHKAWSNWAQPLLMAVLFGFATALGSAAASVAWGRYTGKIPKGQWYPPDTLVHQTTKTDAATGDVTTTTKATIPAPEAISPTETAGLVAAVGASTPSPSSGSNGN